MRRREGRRRTRRREAKIDGQIVRSSPSPPGPPMTTHISSAHSSPRVCVTSDLTFFLPDRTTPCQRVGSTSCRSCWCIEGLPYTLFGRVRTQHPAQCLLLVLPMARRCRPAAAPPLAACSIPLRLTLRSQRVCANRHGLVGIPSQGERVGAGDQNKKSGKTLAPHRRARRRAPTWRAPRSHHPPAATPAPTWRAPRSHPPPAATPAPARPCARFCRPP